MNKVCAFAREDRPPFYFPPFAFLPVTFQNSYPSIAFVWLLNFYAYQQIVNRFNINQYG
ncbi:hypothetical protein GPLA_4458 [Paraglaciecola polaris LMG 21857]|uniref:Uncharacterized protein n=1 Tax=Paraglaciecola polaris LMG 21857 TaxID=1129793 RepID=K6ZYS6_9ALTE|nr:hypothetical protein GPLA_4458 [Paraglaciecola polaris LMG 21857]